MNEAYGVTAKRARFRNDFKRRREIARLIPTGKSHRTQEHVDFLSDQEKIDFNWTGQIKILELDQELLLEVEKNVPKKIELQKWRKYGTRHVTAESLV